MQARLWPGWAAPAPQCAVPHLQGEGAPVEQERAGRGGGQVRGGALQQGGEAGSSLYFSLQILICILVCIRTRFLECHKIKIYFQINASFIQEKQETDAGSGEELRQQSM